MYRLSRIQPTELKKVNKQKGPSESTSIPLGRGNEVVIGGRRNDRSWWESEGEVKWD